jgi:hypothetical protein
MTSSRPPRTIVPILTGLLCAFAAVAWLRAGPINPPSGPVTAGGKTTQEIYDAVSANSQATGAIGGRGPAVPGANLGGGSFSLSTSPVAVGGPILGMRSSFSLALSAGPGGTTIGASQFNSLTIVRDMASVDASLYKAVTFGTNVSTGTITIPSAGGNTVYTLTNSFITGLRHSNIQRADGTFGAIEEIDLTPTTVLITDPSGGHWQYNYTTRAGS